MYTIEVYLQSNRVNFSNMNIAQVGHYLFSFYTDEEKTNFEADLQRCYDNAWIHPIYDYEYYASIGKQVVSVDNATNTMTVTLLIHNIDVICEELFDEPKVGFNPLRKFIDANPSEGSYDIKVLDNNGNDVTSQYSTL